MLERDCSLQGTAEKVKNIYESTVLSRLGSLRNSWDSNKISNDLINLLLLSLLSLSSAGAHGFGTLPRTHSVAHSFAKLPYSYSNMDLDFIEKQIRANTKNSW